MRLSRLVVAGGLTVSLIGFAGWLALQNRTEVAADAPPPGPGYVGAEVCAGCHAGIARKHQLTGHARTLARVDGRPALKRSAWIRDPALPTLARMTRRGRTTGVEVRAGDVLRWQPAQFLFGSGRHGITPVADAGAGRYMELPLSYYPQDGWDHTPGFLMNSPQRRMYHPAGVPADHTLFFQCFDCHATGVRDTEADLDLAHMRLGVQCERCHGPGERHVRAAEQHQSVAGTVRNPGRGTAVEVSRFCGQCHRTQAPAAMKPDAPALVRFAPVGLGRSRCFLESRGKLSCLSCHDPHADADPRPESTEKVCRSCHARAAAPARICPVNAVSGCVRCHMPKVEAAPHSLFTDHWIRPHPSAAAQAAGAPQAHPL